MTQKSDAIALELKEKTGIDFSKYRRPDVVKAVSDTISFFFSPWSVLGAVMQALIVAAVTLNIVAAGLCWYIHPKLWIIITVILCANLAYPLPACFMALRLVAGRLARDLADALEVALDLIKEVFNDLEHYQSTDKTIETRDVIRGVVFVVILPIVSDVGRDRLGFLAYPLIHIMEKILYRFEKHVSAWIEKRADSVDSEGEDKASPFNPHFTAMTRDNVNRLVETVKPQVKPWILQRILPAVTIPLTLLFWVSALLGLLGVSLVYWLLLF